jgi:metal-responsive CopG/Arc/MetJ family transcriptional regulator
MPRDPNKPLVNIQMSPEDLRELDTWRFRNEFAARSEAMRWLMKKAMREAPKISPEEKQAISA